MRFLLILALLFLAIFVLRSFYLRYLRPTQNDKGGQNNVPDPVEIETMVRCRECGTYFPASEAISASSDSVFCSEEHRRSHFSAH